MSEYDYPETELATLFCVHKIICILQLGKELLTALNYPLYYFQIHSSPFSDYLTALDFQKQEGIPPRMFKSVIAANHPEFSTMRQQVWLKPCLLTGHEVWVFYRYGYVT